MLKKVILLCAAAGILLAGGEVCAKPKPSETLAQFGVRKSPPMPTLLSDLIYSHAAEGNVAELKKLRKRGYDLDIKDGHGNTSLCQAIWKNDRKAYQTLRKAGAEASPPCLEKIPPAYKDAVIGSFLASLDADTWADIGLGAAAIGGVIALSSGGGGGGGGSGGGSPPPAPNLCADVNCGEHGTCQASTGLCVCSGGYTGPACDIPPSTDPEDYRTPEFSGANFSYAQDFLGQIKADEAYAYAAANDLPIGGEGITVAVIDNGVDISHQDLQNNILKNSSGQVIGANFDYGPCRGEDMTNCWYYYEYEGSPRAYLFGEDEVIGYVSLDTPDDLTQWEEYYDSFPSDWDWDLHRNDPSPVNAEDDHGTHVAGIIAAGKDDVGMHGVAFNAKIIGIKMPFSGWYMLNDDVISAFQFAQDNGARVINNSWGPEENNLRSTVADSVSAFNTSYGDTLEVVFEDFIQQKATGTDVPITVFAAGNEGNDAQATIISAAPMALPSLLYYRDATDNDILKPFDAYPTDTGEIASSLFVTAVSVNADNELAWYSQTCGTAAYWCIAAPGGERSGGVGSAIASTVPSDTDDAYALMQGTSMAAPVVSGSLAVILGAAPFLKAEEAVAILFESATDLGAAGVDEIFGWGLINLEAAMSPLGETMLALGDSTTSSLVPVRGTRMTIPRTFAASVLSQLPDKIVMFDKYRRGFDVPTSSLIRQTGSSYQAFSNNVRLFANAHRTRVINTSDNFSMRFAQNVDTDSGKAFNGYNFDMTYRSDDSLMKNVRLSFLQDAKQGLGVYFDKVLSNPFTTSATDVYALATTFALGKKWDFGFDVSLGKNNFFDGDRKEDYFHDSQLKTGAAHLSYKPWAHTSVGVVGGLLHEQGSVLGLNGTGALGTGDSRTYFTGVELTSNPLNRWHIAASYYYGVSKATPSARALMTLSEIHSESIGLNTWYALSDKTNIGLNVSSPLYIRRATALFDLPVGGGGETVYRNRVKADIRSQAREWDVGLYAAHKRGLWSFQSQVGTRFNPEHASGKPDHQIMFSARYGF